MSLPVEKRRQWIKSRREQRKLTKYARLRRQLLRYAILCMLLTTGVAGFTNVCWQLSENKNMQGIEIAGNFVAEDSQIRQALKPEIINAPLFFLNPTELEHRIQNLSIVKHAFVRRYALPYPQLKVEVLEEFPWATLYSAASGSKDTTASLRRLMYPCSGSTQVSTAQQRNSCASNAVGLSLYPVSSSLSAASGSTQKEAPQVLVPKFIVAESGRLISIAEFPHVYRPALKIYCNNTAQCNFNANTVESWANWINYISKETQLPVLAIDMRQPQDIKIETSKFKIALGNEDSGLNRRLYRLASVLGVLANQHKEPAYVNLGLNSNIPVKLAKKLDRSGEVPSRL